MTPLCLFYTRRRRDIVCRHAAAIKDAVATRRNIERSAFAATRRCQKMRAPTARRKPRADTTLFRADIIARHLR